MLQGRCSRKGLPATRLGLAVGFRKRVPVFFVTSHHQHPGLCESDVPLTALRVLSRRRGTDRAQCWAQGEGGLHTCPQGAQRLLGHRHVSHDLTDRAERSDGSHHVAWAPSALIAPLRAKECPMLGRRNLFSALPIPRNLLDVKTTEARGHIFPVTLSITVVVARGALAGGGGPCRPL